LHYGVVGWFRLASEVTVASDITIKYVNGDIGLHLMAVTTGDAVDVRAIVVRVYGCMLEVQILRMVCSTMYSL